MEKHKDTSLDVAAQRVFGALHAFLHELLSRIMTGRKQSRAAQGFVGILLTSCSEDTVCGLSHDKTGNENDRIELI